MYACDKKWWDAYADETKVLPAEKWTVDVEAAKVYGHRWVEGRKDVGLAEKPGVVYLGGNSGYQSLGLAYHFGFSRICLLGYDMQGSAQQPHWHGRHPKKLGDPHISSYEIWRARFDAIARDLAGRGVCVVNASKASSLTCFQRTSLNEFFASCP